MVRWLKRILGAVLDATVEPVPLADGVECAGQALLRESGRGFYFISGETADILILNPEEYEVVFPKDPGNGLSILSILSRDVGNHPVFPGERDHEPPV